MKKRLFALLLVVAMLASMIVLPAHATEEQTQVGYCQHCKEVIPEDQWIPWSTTDTGPRTGHYYLSEDISDQTSQITINLDDDLLRNVICLDLRGHSYLVTGIRPFLVYGVFSIMDSVGGGEIAVTGHKANAFGAFAQVAKKSGCKDGSGEVNVYSGTLRRINDDRYVVAYGGLIYLSSGATLNLHGGKLIGGEAKARLNSSGTPVNGMGGTVYATASNVNIYGGTLTGGSAPDTTLTLSDGTTKAYDGSGGNIYAEKSSVVTISGGTVENGYCGTNVGNIYLKESHFVMTGGTVRGGYCEGAAGNVGFTGANGSFKMSGGVIRDGVCVTRGGNLFVNNSSTTVEITGGEIYGDISVGSFKSFKLSGAPKIYMGKGSGLRLQSVNATKMDISGLTEGAVIYLDGVDQTFTGALENAEVYASYFKDAVRADITVTENGELAVAQGSTGYCPHCWESGEQVTWTPWHNNSSTSTSVISETADAHYYLTASVTRKGIVSIGTSSVKTNDVVFDMAGKTMSNETTKLFNLYSTLSLMDSVGGGYMNGYGAEGANGGVIMGATASTFNMYSGTLRRVVTDATEGRRVFRGGVLYGGYVNVYGGTVMGGLVNVPYKNNTPKNPAGGNIYAQKAFTMTAGAIRDGEVRAHTGYWDTTQKLVVGTSVYSGNGGNVYLASNGTITGGHIHGGNATYGAGIYVYNTGTLTITGGVVENGTCNDAGATSNYGGNIYAYGAAATETKAAVYVDVEISNALIRGGTAKRQGGNLYAGYANVTIRDTVISDGIAGIVSGDDGRGGNVYLTGTAVCELYDSTIGNGSSLGHGGNLYGPGGVQLTIHSGLITGGNTNGYGGNMYCNGLTMHGGLITHGTSGENGGNIFVYEGEGNYVKLIAQNGTPTVTKGTAGKLGGNIALSKNTTGTITGAIIENGTGDTANKSSFNADNVYANVGTTLTVTDTKIRGIEADGTSGNGIYAAGKLILEGSTTVTNEEKQSCVYIASAGSLTVDAGFTGETSVAFEDAHFADPEEPQGGIVAEQNTATGVFAGKLLLEGYAGRDYGLPAIFAEENDSKLYIASTAVVDPAKDTVVWYRDNDAAAAALTDSSYLKLYKAENTLNLNGDLVVDLNGNNLTVTGTGKLSGFDSKNDDYTAYGNLTADGEIEVEKVYMAPNGRRYVTLTGETGISFHRLGMQISGVNLRPSVAGMYFNSVWRCDEALAAKITSYGVAVSTANMPGVNFASDSDTLYTVLGSESFQSGQAQTSAIIENILTAGADNAVRGTTPIYATSYAVIDGQLTVTGEDNEPVAGGVSYTLAQLMAKIDLRWPKLTDTQKEQLKALYQLYPEAMAHWQLYNMVAALNGTASVRPLKILTLGHSLAVDSGHMLNLIATAEGYDQELVIGTLYYSGCALWRHVSYLTKDTPAYSLYLSSTATPDKPPVILKDYTMKNALLYDDWDIIIMQGGAFEIAEDQTYTNGDIQTIQNYVNQHKTNPDAIFAWHMPWVFPTVDELRNLYPYSPNSFVTNYQKYNDDRLVFYKAITDCVEKNIVTDNSFVYLIPTGTAVENAMSSYLDEFDIYRDYSHVSDLGRVIASYTWYCTLAGIDQLDEVKLDAIPVAFFKSTKGTEDRVLTDMEKAIILESVNNALANPLQVTQSQYTEAP